jgi:hypothetical protein
MSPESRLRELVQATLTDNHRVEGVRFIDELFPLVSEIGGIQCRLSGEQGLRFQLPGQAPWDVELGRARSKLRMLCARLGVVCQDHNGRDINLYGDEATLEFPTTSPKPSKMHVRFKNTTDAQEFTITAVEDNPPCP